MDRVERGESDTRSARRFSMADYPCGGSGLHNVRMMQNPDKTKNPDPSSDEKLHDKMLADQRWNGRIDTNVSVLLFFSIS